MRLVVDELKAGRLGDIMRIGAGTVRTLPTAVLDRGFGSLGEFNEQARPYLMAARALVALAAAPA